MSQFVDGNTKSFVAGGAIAQHLRVKISSGKLAVAGLTDRDWIGTAMTEAFADGEVISVKLASGAGSRPTMIAVGWNWTNSASRMIAPACAAIARPWPRLFTGLVVSA